MKKGFTLVELLAVIVILAIILAIAIPGISNVIESSKRGAAESNAKMLFKTLEYQMLNSDTFDPITITEANIKEVLGIDDSNYLRLTVKKMDEQLYITMVGKEKWEGLVVSGTKKNIRVDETITATGEIANAPVLTTGMIPVYYDNGVWKKADPTNTNNNWYQYGTGAATNKRWANAVTLNETGTGTGVDGVTRHDRSWYLSQPIGTSISIDDINSMWVWIPRYVYKISTGWHGDGLSVGQAGTINIQFSKGVDDSWDGAIDLRETAYASKSTGLNNNGDKYTNHPAFTFGDTELTGFWMAKFEASSTNPGAANGGGNVTNLKVKSIPNVVSWRNISVNNIFTVTRAMETEDFYGWGNNGNGIDTHLMKNTEWGAVAYLSKSVYGKNDEVYVNPSSSFITGRGGEAASQGGATDSSGSASTALYGYDGRTCSSKTGYVCTGDVHVTYGTASSTTGNIYGIYDMSGSALEYTTSYITNGDANLANGNNILNTESKYKNVYSATDTDTEEDNYPLTASLKGDAMYEISSEGAGATSWYSDQSSTARKERPWIDRGGSYYYGANGVAGVFNFTRYTGGSGGDGTYIGFRTVLIVGAGL